jgi:regulator of cell morphogenesis and NO signaling
VHQDRWGKMLLPLREHVTALTRELTWHTRDEEDRLFPAILALEENEPATLRGSGLDRFLARLEDEHAMVGALLADIEKLTHGFTPPRDACATFHALFEELRAFDLRLKEHVHLENHILFPRAAALGRRMADGSSGGQP